MKIAALQLNCKFADVENNMMKIKKYIIQASHNNAELILLPEFFSSAVGFLPEMNNVALKGPQIQKMLREWSAEFKIIIGGSYLCFDGTDSHNTFDLVFPDGKVFSHQKDIPTQFENCYYTRGDINHILHTPIGNIGIALCWEMIRYDTLKRISRKVDFILAGSCWWDLPVDAPIDREPLRKYNQTLAIETPVTFAKLLHVPLIHANHCGQITAYNFPAANRMQTRQFVGATQILDAEGNIIKQRKFNEGEGLVIADFDLNKSAHKKVNFDQERYWIPDLPDSYISAWNTVNPIAETYYKDQILPYYHANFNI
ncbi:MAG: carbon-nitrogen hydrolase family protein [Eubacteriales bacterium]